MDIADSLIQNTVPGGIILASGILVDQVDAVEKAFVKTHATQIVETRKKADWIMLRIMKFAG